MWPVTNHQVTHLLSQRFTWWVRVILVSYLLSREPLRIIHALVKIENVPMQNPLKVAPKCILIEKSPRTYKTMTLESNRWTFASQLPNLPVQNGWSKTVSNPDCSRFHKSTGMFWFVSVPYLTISTMTICYNKNPYMHKEWQRRLILPKDTFPCWGLLIQKLKSLNLWTITII